MITPPNITLSNGVTMPHIGLGTYPLYGDQLTQVICDSYKEGYRLIDTADNYFNEKDLGESLRIAYQQGAKREEFFLVSKVSDELYPIGSLNAGTNNRGLYFWKTSSEMQDEKAVKRVLNKKLRDTLIFLKTDYLDLWLMHWPYPDFFVEIWDEMLNIYKEGKVRAIGVCNCRNRHLNKLQNEGLPLPMVNQIESSPVNAKTSTVDFCKENDVAVMIYSPLMSLRFSDMTTYMELLNSLSSKYCKNPAQINLRFNIQRGLIPIPKSTHKERLASNINVFDFALNDAEMQALMRMNINRQTLPESKQCPGL